MDQGSRKILITGMKIQQSLNKKLLKVMDLLGLAFKQKLCRKKNNLSGSDILRFPTLHREDLKGDTFFVWLLFETKTIERKANLKVFVTFYLKYKIQHPKIAGLDD